MKRLTPASLRRPHQRPEAVEVDRPAEFRIKIERRIVGNAGEMDHGVAAGQRLAHVGGIAQVALDLAAASHCR